VVWDLKASLMTGLIKGGDDWMGIKVLCKGLVGEYIRQFCIFYNIISKLETFQSLGGGKVEVPSIDLDFEGESRRINYGVYLEDVMVEGDIGEFIGRLNTRNTDRRDSHDWDILEGRWSYESGGLKAKQASADYLDGYMWGLCISIARAKYKAGIQSSKDFKAYIIKAIKSDGIILC
jgi:hypothetical protein